MLRRYAWRRGASATPRWTLSIAHLQSDNVDAHGGSARRECDARRRCSARLGDVLGDRYGQLRDPFGVKWSIATPIRKS